MLTCFDGQIQSPPAESAGLAHLGVAESVSVMRADRDWGGEAFHPAPRRQLLTVVAGAWHVTTSRGTERSFGIGQRTSSSYDAGAPLGHRLRVKCGERPEEADDSA